MSTPVPSFCILTSYCTVEPGSPLFDETTTSTLNCLLTETLTVPVSYADGLSSEVPFTMMSLSPTVASSSMFTVKLTVLLSPLVNSTSSTIDAQDAFSPSSDKETVSSPLPLFLIVISKINSSPGSPFLELSPET